jgi:NMD protein affecting ribosome stability and mRNA decay
MVGQQTCPNCGAPIGNGELVCGYCRTDVRSLVEVPLVVSRLELY